jgi:membrane protein YqaA with SNARE-associated domain
MAQPGNPNESSLPAEDGSSAGTLPAEEKQSQVRRVLVPVLTIALVIAISIGLYLVRNQIVKLKEYAYLGVFVISLLTNATVIVPVPGIVAFVPLLQSLNPVLVGVAGAAGGSIGEVTGYMAGYSGGKLTKRSRLQTRVRGWMGGRRGGWVLFLFAAGPLPVDVAGVVAGALRYPLWRFMLIVWIGKTIKYIVLMVLASLGIEWLMRWVDLFG